MPRALHIIDENTPADMLGCLDLLVQPGEKIASAGPSPRYGEFKQPVIAVHRPFNLDLLCGLRMRDLAGDAAVIHAWSASAARAGLAIARRRGMELVYSLPHAPSGAQLPALVKTLRKRSIHVTVPTVAAQRRLVQAGAPQQAVHCLPPPAPAPAQMEVPRRHVRRELGLTDQDVLLVAPAEMTAWAGHKYASWTHAILRQILPNVRLLFPGAGPAESRVRYFARTTGYDGEVFFTGERFCRSAALAAADVAVFFCLRDCGVEALAATMAAGRPIAASATPDIAECAPHEQAALLARPADPRTASAALLRLIEDPNLAGRLAARARQIAAERFDPSACRRRLDAVYEAAGARLA